MKDRQPTKPGRVLITPEDGSTPFYAVLARADEPTEPGTPYNKATQLSDETSALLGGAETVDEALAAAAAPIGSIFWYTQETPPSGYLICDGSEISRVDYAALFSVIGTAFGEGDGETTFTLPDLRAKFIRGAGASGAFAATFGVTQPPTNMYGATGAFHDATIGNSDFTESSGTISAEYASTHTTTKSYTRMYYHFRPYNIALTPIIKY